MYVASPRFSVVLLMGAFGLGCGDASQSIVGTDGVDAQFGKPTCPGHPSCGDPPAPAGNATADLSGDVTTASAQPVVISKDSKNQLAGSGGADDFSIVDALAFFVAAGAPSPGALGGCVTDPPDLASTDPVTVQRLIDRLTDDSQSRTFRFTVNRKDPANMTGNINQSWFDNGDDGQYRTRVSESVVTSPSEDVYDYAQGSIVSWDMSTNEKLVCPNGGSVRLTLNR